MASFGGFVADSPRAPAPVPTAARIARTTPFPLWLIGHQPPGQAAVITSPDGYLAVFGPCAATPRELAALVDHLPDDAVSRWAGAYVIVRAARDHVTVLTDPATAVPIYFTTTPQGVAWASSSRTLAALTGAGVDAAWLAAAISHPASPNTPNRSAFADVAAVPGGHRLIMRPGRPPRITPAWRPDRTSPEAAAQRLSQALSNGVAVRVTSSRRPTSDLSGGMDSTAVCLLAAVHSARPVTAVTVHPAGVTNGGDLDYARTAASHRPGIHHRFLPLDARHLPYTALDDVPPTDEPAPSTITYARLAAELRMLAQLGSDLHLTGDGGDSLLIPPPAYLADLARSGRFVPLIRHAQGRARLYQVSPWPMFAQAFTPRPQQPAPPAWVTADARQLAADAAEPVPTWPHARHADAATLGEMRMVGRSARADAQLAETFGVPIHNPFTDGAVIAAALAAAPWRRGDPWRYKPLLAAALGDQLPRAIAYRATKGAFDNDHYSGIRTNLATAHDLAHGRLTQLGLIDPAAAHAAIDRAAAGLPVVFGHLEPALAAEVWIRAVSTAPPITWRTLRPEALT